MDANYRIRYEVIEETKSGYVHVCIQGYTRPKSASIARDRLQALANRNGIGWNYRIEKVVVDSEGYLVEVLDRDWQP